MQDTFITKIQIGKVRHLTNVEIALSDTELKHLILTGKNGSGKTILLEAIRDLIETLQRQPIPPNSDSNTPMLHYSLHSAGMGISVYFSRNLSSNIANYYDTTFAYFPAERSELEISKSIEPTNILGKHLIGINASKDFSKHVLYLYIQYLSAKDTNRPTAEIQQYKSWFDRFTQALRDIYDCEELDLNPDMKNLRFIITMPGREPFGLHEMADGYKAFLEIVMELLIRMDGGNGIVDHNQPAIVLIDEIETHLHVEMQKRALPFLTKLFPRVQFIVSTHSPFVITSLSNAVVYDLEKQEQLDNPSYYSYEAVVESFLDADMYSEEMKRNFTRYKELCFKTNRSAEENKEFLRIKTELELMSPASKELYIAFRALEQKRKEVLLCP